VGFLLAVFEFAVFAAELGAEHVADLVQVFKQVRFKHLAAEFVVENLPVRVEEARGGFADFNDLL